jgi:hypothetical protein
MCICKYFVYAYGNITFLCYLKIVWDNCEIYFQVVISCFWKSALILSFNKFNYTLTKYFCMHNWIYYLRLFLKKQLSHLFRLYLGFLWFLILLLFVTLHWSLYSCSHLCVFVYNLYTTFLINWDYFVYKRIGRQFVTYYSNFDLYYGPLFFQKTR